MPGIKTMLYIGGPGSVESVASANAMIAIKNPVVGTICLRTDDRTESATGTQYQLIFGTGANTTDWAPINSVSFTEVSIPGANGTIIDLG